MAYKKFFRERSAADIRNLKCIKVQTLSELVEAHISSKPDEHVKMENPMFSPEISARSFNKYGPITRLRNYVSVDECIKYGKRPLQMLKEETEKMQEPTLGYAIIPPQLNMQNEALQLNLEPRIVAWKECFEGARVFAYSVQKKVPIRITFRKTGNAEYEGVTIIGTVPSRTQGKPRHKITLEHIPSVLAYDTRQKLNVFNSYIPLTIQPSADTEKRRYAKLRSGLPGLKIEGVLPIMWADIALYLEYARSETEMARHHVDESGSLLARPVSADYSPFPFITAFACEMYRKLKNNTLNKFDIKLRDGELNLAAGQAFVQLGFGKIMAPSLAIDGRIQDYDWSIPHI